MMMQYVMFTCLSDPFLSLTRLFAAGLGEFRIRDLNDEINKLLREKGHWEVRIKELGGPDYAVNNNQYLKPVTVKNQHLEAVTETTD